MQADEWEEIKRCFEIAIRLGEPGRLKFLDTACAARPALRATVEELLTAHRDASGFLNDEVSLPSLPLVFSEGQLVADRFRIIRLISRGGMGEVYEAFDDRLSVTLALKTLRSEYASDQEALDRFRREISVTRDLSHPNLCRVYELIEHRLPASDSQTAGRLITCFSMQLMCGETLQHYLARNGPLSTTAAFPLIRQMAGAIEALHSAGIIHRDLKPSNIMITPGRDGELRAVVMDFGLAKPLRGRQEMFESRTDFQAGAPFYIAPELLRGEKPSVASDIYALGLIVDGMVTNSSAFSGDSVEAILYQKVSSEPKDPQSRAPELPANWCQTIRRCLAREPSRRYARVSDLLTDLLGNSAGSRTRPLPLIYRATRAFSPSAFSAFSRYGSPRFSSSRSSAALALAALVALIALAAEMVYLVYRPLNTSVVVFDFENLTAKPEYDAICKGAAAEIERRMVGVPGLRVKPFHQTRPKDFRSNREADFLVDGQLQTEQGLTRLAVQVTEASSGALVWANNFDTRLIDTLTVQNQIASGAADAMLDAVLLPPGTARSGPLAALILFLRRSPPLPLQQPAPAATQSSVALEAYMRGHALWEDRSLASVRQAIVLFNSAIRADNNFALAYADLSGAELTLTEYHLDAAAPHVEAARRAAEQAIAKGPGFAESYTAMAAIKQYLWDWNGAESDFKRAIQLNPKFARAHRWYGGFLLQFGKFDQALAETRTAINLDPYDFACRYSLGGYLIFANRPQQAVDYMEQALKEKDSAWGRVNLAYAYAALALHASRSNRAALLGRALQETDLVARADKEPNTGAIGLSTPLYALLFALRGDRARARQQLGKMVAAEPGAVCPEDIAGVYLALGDQRSALNVLRSAVSSKDAGTLYLKVNVFLQPARNTREFKELIAQARL